MTIFAAGYAIASGVKVIANPSVKVEAISPGELKKIFLEEKLSLHDGTHVEPVLEKGGAVHGAFLQEYLGLNEEDLHAYYQALLFTGRGFIPKAFASEDEVVAYVARTRGAIGYVSSVASAEGVKVIAIGVPSASAERKLLTRVEPDYPDTLRKLYIGGTVRLRVSISAAGHVEKVELLGGNPVLGEAAAAAVKKWVYTTGTSRTEAEVSLSFDGR